ncbi:FmdB family zinc ribbon protein [Arthrobacter cryoconiti]|uniref:FmdB family zinc ribbon protein n=1 Tax=Arthrobacter cryoconiti TaxID=748907 RepID=A0ABV8R0L6_9MICC|nr:FmdB family zinc ribbon protein [Arthrobacter cryoconiti]MCC9069299.1 FmdB family transcriptional regulator [Arthrobacter cryoconiti]
MPTYAYACKDCGHAFDIHQAFSDDSLTVCPECQGALRKKFNSVGVVFKGSGFYRTDSRAGASGVPAAGSGSDSGANASPAAASTDSKAASSASSSTAGKSDTASSIKATAKSNSAKTPANVGN